MKYIILFAIIASHLISISQTGPSGITGCQLWLRADVGTKNGGAEVTHWGVLDEW